MPNSYRPMMEFATEAPVGNAMRYPTYDEADKSASDLFNRWTVPTGYHVDESDDPPNYQYIDGANKRITIAVVDHPAA